MKSLIVCISTASAASVPSPITSNQVAYIPHPDVQHQQPPCTDIGLKADVISERTEANVAVKSLPITRADNCSAVWHGSINGGVSLLWHRPESPSEHSSRILQQPPDPSPHRRSPLRQKGIRLDSWHAPRGSSLQCSAAQRNGLVSLPVTERMDTSDELPLNLSVAVRSSAALSNNTDSRRRIFPSG